MKIGFVNIYSYRPHVEHLYYLATLLEKAGHEVFYLTCDSSVSGCYTKLLKCKGTIAECSKCILGGIRSYTSKNVTSISKYPLGSQITEQELKQIVFSSSSTLTRVEDSNDAELELFSQMSGKLLLSAERTFSSTMQWIKENELQGVLCFNGRMDLTRAVTYACEKSNIPFITHERPWLGHGLQLIPGDNCLSLRGLRALVDKYDALPLAKDQASYAARLLRIRFSGDNHLEWRLYNTNPDKADWPLDTPKGKLKVLVIPSSRNEFLGHSDWSTGWLNNNQALDDLFDVFNIDSDQVVVRFHPNWSESIGQVEGEFPRMKYQAWCEDRGIYYYPAESKASTYDLINEADLIVVNGGSSAVEAAYLGKQVVCLSPAMYTGAKFVTTYRSRQEMEQAIGLPKVSQNDIIASVLRFMYIMSHRFPQYVDYVRAEMPIKYTYSQGADASRLVKMLETGRLEADDTRYAESDLEEKRVIEAVLSGESIEDVRLEPKLFNLLPLQRRNGFNWVDSVRNRFKIGDR